MREKHSVELIKAWFGYDSERGILTRLQKENSLAFDEIEFRSSVRFKGECYSYAALCWIVYYGEYPKNWIDHKNGRRGDNKITNLRDVTPTQNQQNKAGCGQYAKGVIWRDRKTKPWQAKIRVNGNRIHLGSFETEEEAAEAYRQAAIQYHGEFANVE